MDLKYLDIYYLLNLLLSILI